MALTIPVYHFVCVYVPPITVVKSNNVILKDEYKLTKWRKEKILQGEATRGVCVSAERIVRDWSGEGRVSVGDGTRGRGKMMIPTFLKIEGNR